MIRIIPLKARYAVVQDLLPFGYRIESVHTLERSARIAMSLSGYRYLKVLPLAFVKAENERLGDMKEFEKEFAKMPPVKHKRDRHGLLP